MRKASYTVTTNLVAICMCTYVCKFKITSKFCRSSISSQLQGGCEDNIQKIVPCIRPHLSLSLPEDCEPQGRSSSQHLLQALHTVYLCKLQFMPILLINQIRCLFFIAVSILDKTTPSFLCSVKKLNLQN